MNINKYIHEDTEERELIIIILCLYESYIRIVEIYDNLLWYYWYYNYYTIIIISVLIENVMPSYLYRLYTCF